MKSSMQINTGLVLALLLFIAVCPGCKKKESSNGTPAGDAIDLPAGKISGKIVNWSEGSGKTLKPSVEQYSVYYITANVGSGTISSDGSFSLSLTAPPGDWDYMRPVVAWNWYFCSLSNMTVSDTSARLSTHLWFDVYDGSDPIGLLYRQSYGIDDNYPSQGNSEADFIYSSKPFTILGTESCNYIKGTGIWDSDVNCTIHAGWNEMVDHCDSYNPQGPVVHSVVGNSENGTLKWYYESYKGTSKGRARGNGR